MQKLVPFVLQSVVSAEGMERKQLVPVMLKSEAGTKLLHSDEGRCLSESEGGRVRLYDKHSRLKASENPVGTHKARVVQRLLQANGLVELLINVLQKE